MRPRVLFVGRSRYRLPLDGAQRRKWEALARELDVRVLGTAADGAGPVGDETFRLVSSHEGGGAFYAALPVRVARQLRDFRPEVVVTQSPYEAAAALAGRRLARVPARVLLEVHGDWRTATRLYGSPLRRLVEPVSGRLAESAVRHADAVRTVGPFTSGLVRGLGVEPASTFTAYVDVSAFTRRPPAPLPPQPAALFVGVLERYKDVDGLASAWRLAAPRLPEATLRIVGEGRLTESVRRLVADSAGRVSWTPALSSDGVADALDEASLLVLASRSEGLPRIVIEAFCRGRPVVGTRAGGIPDIVEDEVSGLLVPPGDPVRLADALVKALADRELLERLASGAAAAAPGWIQSPEEFAERMRELVVRMRSA
jgi:glycosyltransferase involved in cell wall biosynthesis